MRDGRERLREQFEKNFKVGGVAAVSAGGPGTEKTVASSDLTHNARIAATRLK